MTTDLVKKEVAPSRGPGSRRPSVKKTLAEIAVLAKGGPPALPRLYELFKIPDFHISVAAASAICGIERPSKDESD